MIIFIFVGVLILKYSVAHVMIFSHIEICERNCVHDFFS
jgi:hypothetical protein